MTWHPTRRPSVPPTGSDNEGPWEVRLVRWDGTTQTAGTLAAFASAQAYAETIARSLARNDRSRAWLGYPTSGVQAVTVAWDVWDIPAMVLGEAGVRAVPVSVPRSEVESETLKLALAYATRLAHPDARLPDPP